MSGTQFPLRYFPIVINGSATSPDINISGMTLVGIDVPSGIAGTSMTFTAALSHGGTYNTVTDTTGTTITIPITASKRVAIPPSTSAGLEYFRMVSSASETSKTFTLVCRQLS